MDRGAAAYRRFLEGDDKGIEELIAEYKDGLILYLAGFCGGLDTAEELMEDVFVKLVVDRPAYKGKSSFKTWLFAIAGNIARDYIRKNRRVRFSSLDELGELSSPESDLLRDHFRSEEKLLVRKCLDKLNPQYKQVLYLVFFEGFSNAEAAKIMKKSVRQIENLLYRAKKSLETQLREEGFDYEK